MPRRIKHPFNPAMPPKRQRKYGKRSLDTLVTVECKCPECGLVKYRISLRNANKLIFDDKPICMECGMDVAAYKVSR